MYICTFITFVLKAQSLIKVAEGGANPEQIKENTSFIWDKFQQK